MKENSWIYLSCLLFCGAIGYSMNTYTLGKKSASQLRLVNEKYLDQLVFNYNTGLNDIRCRIRNKSYASYYSKHLTIIEYLMDGNKVKDLKDLYDARYTAKVLDRDYSKVDSKVMQYRYASALINHYRTKLNAEVVDYTTVLDVEVLDLSRSHKFEYGLEFNFYDRVMDDVEYSVDGVALPIFNGGAASKNKISDLDIVIENLITREKYKMNFNDIKA